MIELMERADKKLPYAPYIYPGATDETNNGDVERWLARYGSAV